MAAAVFADEIQVIDGKEFIISNGNAYRRENGHWQLFDRLYDPDFYRKNYIERGGKVFRAADGREWEMSRSFAADLEGVNDIRGLIGEKCRFTEFTLQSPRTPTVKEYVALRARILKGESGFLDNAITLETNIVHGGTRSLKCMSVPAGFGMVCAKTSVSTEFIHFRKGDHCWYSAWYYIDEGMPFTIVDIESSWIAQSPGPRIAIDDRGVAYIELKWAEKPKYRPKDSSVTVPRKRWFHIELHLLFSEKADGIIELWQDGRKTVDAVGRTLPLADTIMNSLEIGISANLHDRKTVLYVDDVRISELRSMH